MLTGRQLFGGDTVTDTLAAVLTKEPNWEGIPAQVLPLMQACLEKDPKRRLRDIADVWRLQQLPIQNAVPTSNVRSNKLPWVVAAILALIAVVGIWRPWRKPVVAPSGVFQIYPADGETFAGVPVISPNGELVAAHTRDAAGTNHLMIRRIDALAWESLKGTEGAGAASWSFDSRYLAFNSGTSLKKIDIAGGPAQTLCEIPLGGIPFTAWTEDGQILFSGANGIRRVSSSGGASVPVTAIDLTRGEDIHGAPRILPGRRFLYFIRSAKPENSGIFVGSLDAPLNAQVRKAVVTTTLTTALFSHQGSGLSSVDYLLFARGGALVAQPFDLRRLQLTGDAFPVLSKIGLAAQVLAASVSQTGTLVFFDQSEDVQFAWVDRTGKHLANAGQPGNYIEFALSPDEKRIAVVRPGGWNRSQTEYLDSELGRLRGSQQIHLRCDIAPPSHLVGRWQIDHLRR
jgi:hypothetical protein